MLSYWLLFAFFAVGALLSVSARQNQALTPLSANASVAQPEFHPTGRMSHYLLFGFVFLFLMIGFRWEVGGDWINYLSAFDRSRLWTLEQHLGKGDWGYQSISYLVAQLGGSIVFVNVLVTVPFVWGLYRLAHTQPEPWLMMVVAVPYLIIVVGMGYTRQAAALGFLMMGIAQIIKGRNFFRFACYVATAALFHRTSIIFLPLMLFVFPQSRVTSVVMIAALSLALNSLFLQDSFERLSRNYIEARYSSSGASIRIAQLALAATIFFVARKSLAFPALEGRIWRNLSIVSLATVPILIFSPSSTVIDRLSLYLLPLQLVVLARLDSWIRPQLLARVLVVTYSAVVLFVWLNYAVNSFAWLPYQNVLFVGS